MSEHHNNNNGSTRNGSVHSGGSKLTAAATIKGALSVCLVDDDPSVLKATGRLLSSAGWNVEAFTDPLAFLRYANEHHPKLVVLDIRMPTMNGLEVQTRLRTVSPSTRVVILTSKDDPGIRNKAIDLGAHGFFLKPVDDDEFLAGIDSAASEASFD